MLQLANHSNVSLNKETLPLLHHWMDSHQYSKARISARNKPGAYIMIFTGTLIGMGLKQDGDGDSDF